MVLWSINAFVATLFVRKAEGNFSSLYRASFKFKKKLKHKDMKRVLYDTSRATDGLNIGSML